jgi:DNA-binding response OmpR family regulator
MTPSTDHACILLLEPEVLARSPLAGYLRDCGYVVFETGTALEARKVLSENAHRINVVLADIETVNDAGFELASWIRRQFPGITVVLAGTVASTAEKAGHICEKGPKLSKPYEHHIVLSEIKRLLASRERSANAS